MGSYTSFIDNLDEKSASSDRLKKRGCELAWRLFYSLQGGAKNGEGDARCTGRAGTTAFIRVDLNNAQDTGVYFKGKPGEKACSLKKNKKRRLRNPSFAISNREDILMHFYQLRLQLMV